MKKSKLPRFSPAFHGFFIFIFYITLMDKTHMMSIMALAIVLAFSCSSDGTSEETNQGISSSSNEIIGSSSSVAIDEMGSSSSIDITGDSSSSGAEQGGGSSSSDDSSSSSSVAICGGSPYDPTTEYCSNGAKKAYGYVEYQNQRYKTIAIGSQTWMAENLNYNISGSKCYNDSDFYCTTYGYGRLYDWVTAMALPANCSYTSCASQIKAKHRGICPADWHLPSGADWDVLMIYVQTDNEGTYTDGSDASIAGKYLKAASGWGGSGEDKYGFAALPGGIGDGLTPGGGDISFSLLYSYGYWWSASEASGDDRGSAHSRRMSYDVDVADWRSSGKTYLMSVRCLQD